MRPRLLLSLSVIAAFAFGGAPAANADIFDPVGGTDTSSVPSGRYLVKFAAGTSEADQAAALAAAGANDLSYVAALRLHSVTLPDGAVDQLRAESSVDRVEAEQARAATATPSDPGYPDQWSLEKIGWNQVYGSLSPSGSATVALLDTGVDASHADLAGNVVPGTSILDPGSNGATDSNGHGTEMAGIVAASTDNGEGIAGVGYAGVNVMPVTVLDSSGVGQDGDIIKGVIWAADHGADVILMAFSSPDFSPSLQEAIDYAWSQGAVLVGATGNDGSSASHFPAGDRGVVGVANTDVSDALNTSSNYGEGAFMAAPGTGIYTTTAGGGYATITGTSASAAVVAGAAALLKANDSAASNGTVVGRLARNADPTLSTGTGNGRLNLARAVGDDGTDSVRPEGSAPVGGGGPLVGPYVTAAATDGTGSLTASPTTVGASSTGNDISFTFTSPGGNAGDFRAAGSNFTITVPGGWSAPQTASPAGPGHVSLGTVVCPSQQAAPAASVSGNVITVTNRCNGGMSIEVDYSNVTAPSTPGSFTFNATSQEGNAGSAALTGGSPSIAVKHGTTTAITNSLSTPTAVNQPYAVDVSVTRTTGTTTPSGTATVSDGSVNCVAPLSGSGATVTGSCNLTSTTAGSKTITATYNGDATFVGSTSPGVAHTVNAFGAATKLRFVQQPSNVVAGQPITPAVTVEVTDDFNNRVTSSTAPVTMSLDANPGGATLGGTLTRNAVSGLATFNDLTVDKIANGYRLAAASAGLTAATSSTFDATPGTCTSLSDGVWNAAARWSCNRIPTASDDVTVAANHDVTIPLGFSAVARSFSINPAAGSNPSSLTLSGATSSLAVSGDVRIQRPGNNNISALNVNAGSMTVGGSVTLDGTNTSVGRVNRVAITTGTLDINGNLVFVTGTASGLAAQNVVDMTGGNGTLNLAGAFTAGASGTNAQGTLSPGTTSTFNFDGTSAQTIPVGTAGLTVTYNNLHTNNTSSGGATPSGPISSTNVTGNLRIQSGTFDNGGQGIVGGAGDNFEVANGATFRLSGSTTTPLTFTKTFGATSNTDYAGATQNIGGESYGNISLNGTGVKSGPNAFSVRGNWTLNTGTTFAGSAAPVTFSGTAGNQHIGGALPTTFNAMTVDKTSGTVTLDNTTTATGALGLTDGTITTGANTMIANGAVNRTLGFINGNERRPAVPGTTNLTFDVGTGSTYSPAALNFASVTTAGTVTAAATATEHPNIATSGIRPDKSVNRYWTLTPAGGLAFTNYSATFTFVAGDVDPGANTGNFVVKRYDGTNWHATTTGTQGATSTQATGITSMSDFAVGEADAAGPVTSNTQVAASPTKTAPTVTANVNDATTGGNNVTAAEYFIDSAGADGTGTAMDAADGTFNSVSENVTKALTVAQFNALSDGQHTIYVHGRDVAGNWGATESANFTKDTTGPTTSITFPADAGVYNTAGWNAGCPTPGICGTAADPSGFGAVRVSIKRNSDSKYWDGSSFVAGPENFLLATGAASWSYALAASNLTDGVSYTVHAKGTDALTNQGGVTSATFTYDATAPTVGVEQAAGQNDPTNAQPIHFTAQFSESVTGFTAGDVSVGGTAGHAAPNVVLTANGGNSYDIAVSNLSSDGTVTASIAADKVQDAAGNGNSESSSVDNEVTLDQTKPHSEASSPAYSNADDSTIPVDYTAGDNTGGTGLDKVELWAKKNDGAWALSDTNETPGISGTFTYTPSPGDGTYRFYTIAVDNAGNRENVPTEADAVTVMEDTKTLRDTVAPDPTLTAPPAFTNDNTPAIAGIAGKQTANETNSADNDHVTVTVFSGTTLIQTHSNVAVNATTGAFTVDADELADGVYTAHVDQADAAGNTGSADQAFEVDTLAPAAPTIDSGPADPTKETTADFTFTPAEAGGTLECKLDGGSYVECDSRTAQSYTGLGEGSHTFSVRQVDVAGNPGAADTFTWFVDLTAPTTSIDSTPDDPSNDTSPSFTFSGTDNHSDAADLTFECKLDDGDWYDCDSPDALSDLAEGSHDYYVRATDEAGNTDASPDQFTWFVDLTAPNTTIDENPSDPSSDDAPHFEFSGTDNHSAAGDLTFECKLDEADWYDCDSPQDLTDLDDGEHTFKVRATDEAGNTDDSPASYTWVIDSVKPASEASSPATTNDTVATFEVHYTASDERSGLDTVDLWASKNGGAYSLTNTDDSPDDTRTFNFAHDGDGTYRFYTIATDKAGNVEAVPVGDDDVTVVEDSKTLRDTVAPTVTLSAPPENTNDDTPRIAGKAGTQAANDSNSADDDHVTVEVLDDTDTVIDTHNNVSVDSAGDFFVDANHLEDGDYTAKATQADGATNSGTATRAFTVDTDAPAAPTIDSGPDDPTKDTSAAFTFHGDEPGGTLECKLDSGSYQTCDSPQDYDSLGEGSHTFSVRQVDAAGNPSDPDSATWFVDVTEPNTSIGTKPSDPDNDATPDFSFSGTDNHTADGDLTFECQIDGLGWNSCSSPKTLATLSDGEHTFEVRATDEADNTDSTPASYTWTVDTDTPDAPNITNGPGHLTKLSDASFEWTGEAGGEFECKVDAAAFSHCHSPEPYVVGEGHHTFSVRQIDDAGNTGPAAAYEWDVDQTNPNTSIGTKPANPDNDPTPDFTFTGTDNHSAPADLTFECQIDGLGWNACNSPKTLAALTDGEHTFEVRATDQAGNTDATPASWTWTVDTGTPAAPAITSPANNSFNNTGNVTVEGTAEAGASVEVFDGATSKGTTTATGSGSWSKALTGVADGSHPYTAKATDAAHNTSGASNSRTVVVDTVKPASQASAPATSSSNSITVTYTASDERSGVDKVELYAKKDAGAWTLVGTDTDPSSPSFSFTATGNGTYGFYTRAYDKAGNPEDAPATADATTVVSTGPVYNFSGFKEPVNNLPTLNLAKAGSNIPLKFSLGGYKGMNIFWTGYPKSESILCNSTAPVDGIESTDNPGNSALTYDAATDMYHYNWKTDKSWSLCRQLVMRFADGTSYGRADFKFSK